MAFDPTFVLDKSDPELKDRWPSGFAGFVWRLMAIFRAKPPEVAGEPLAELMLSNRDRGSVNGALFVLDKRSDKRDEAMNDEADGERESGAVHEPDTGPELPNCSELMNAENGCEPG